MFWGLVVEYGRRYQQIVETSFHVSKAVGKSLSGPYELVVRHNNLEFILCHLTSKNVEANLNLNFTEGEEIEFSINRPVDTAETKLDTAAVHLTGYYISPFMNNAVEDVASRSSRRHKVNGHATKAEKGALKRSIDEGESEGEDDAGPSSGKVAKTEGESGGATLSEMINSMGAQEEEDEEDDDFDAADNHNSDVESEDSQDDEDNDDESEEDLEDLDDELAGLQADMDMSLTALKVPPANFDPTAKSESSGKKKKEKSRNKVA